MPMSKRIVRALGLSLVGALILAALCAGALILGTDGADLSYRTLDYDVTATADGDLKVTEHIDIKLRKRKDDDGNPQPYVPGKDGLTLDGYSEDKTVEIGWNIPTTVKPTASSSR